MRYAYDITHAEVIIRDYRIFSSSALAQGALMQLGTTDPDSGADKALALVPAFNATPGSTAIDAVGILNENTFAASAPNGDPTSTTPSYGKVIINPFAVYRAEHSQAAADDAAITSTSGTTVTVPSLPEDLDGYWIYFPLTAAGVKGSFRLLTASAVGSATMASALSVAGTAADTVIVIAPELKYSFNLSSDSTKVSSGAATGANDATNIRVLHSYIDKDEGLEILKANIHRSIDNLNLVRSGFGPKFYYDLLLKDHAFGVQE